MTEDTQAKTGVADFLRNQFEQARSVLISPRETFRAQRALSGYWEPTAFAALCILVPRSVYALFWAPFTLGVSIIWLVPSVFYGLAFLYMLSAALYGLVRCYKRILTFDSVFRCVAYSWIAYFLLLVPLPLLNHVLIGAAFGFYLQFALQEVHGLKQKQAIWISVAIAALVTLIGAAMALVAWAMALTGLINLGYYMFA